MTYPKINGNQTQGLRDLGQLHPCLQRGAKELIKRCSEQGLKIGICETYRTPEYQNSLFKKGSSKCDGYKKPSPHQSRMAFDFYRNDGQGAYNTSGNFFDKVGAIWTAMGGKWGGSWVGFKDNPHCEYLAGLSYLQAFKKQPADTIKMPWETQKNAVGAAVVKKIEVNGVGVNLRKGPGTNFEVVGKATNGQVFEVLETQNGMGSNSGWARTPAGWIALDFTKKL